MVIAITFIKYIFRYHHFRNMPIPFGETENVMECIPEPNNIHDPMAVLVKEMGNDRVIGRVPKTFAT